MKKRFIFVLFVLSILFVSLFLVHGVQLPDSQAIKDKTGIDPSQPLPDPQDVAHDYLKKEWSKIIEKTAVLGPIHKFFLSHPLVFQFIFATPYEFSLLFICIFILWVIVALQAGKFIKSAELVGTSYIVSLIVGIFFSIILAQTGLYKLIASFFLDLLIRNDKWFIRLLIVLAALAILIIDAYLAKITNAYIKDLKKGAAERKEKQNRKIIDREVKGIKEGKSFMEKYTVDR